MDLNQTEKTQAANLWNLFSINVAFNPVIRRHPKHDFLGYVNLTLTGREGTIVEGFHIYLNDLRAKILPKGQYLEMKQEPGRRDNDPKYYSAFAPGNRVTRAVLTTAVFTDPAVIAAVEQLKTMPRPSAEDGSSAPAADAGADAGANPFVDQ